MTKHHKETSCQLTFCPNEGLSRSNANVDTPCELLAAQRSEGVHLATAVARLESVVKVFTVICTVFCSVCTWAEDVVWLDVVGAQQAFHADFGPDGGICRPNDATCLIGLPPEANTVFEITSTRSLAPDVQGLLKAYGSALGKGDRFQRAAIKAIGPFALTHVGSSIQTAVACGVVFIPEPASKSGAVPMCLIGFGALGKDFAVAVLKAGLDPEIIPAGELTTQQRTDLGNLFSTTDELINTVLFVATVPRDSARIAEWACKGAELIDEAAGRLPDGAKFIVKPFTQVAKSHACVFSLAK